MQPILPFPFASFLYSLHPSDRVQLTTIEIAIIKLYAIHMPNYRVIKNN